MSITGKFGQFVRSIVERAAVDEVHNLVLRGPLDERIRNVITTYLSERVRPLVDAYLAEKAEKIVIAYMTDRFENVEEMVVERLEARVAVQVERILAEELEAIAEGSRDENTEDAPQDEAQSADGGVPIGNPSELAEKTIEFLTALERQYFVVGNNSPTYKELYQATGRRDPNWIADSFRELERKGWIERTKVANRYRTTPLKRLPEAATA